PQNQLAEEIRSILAGTISIRHTRIAAALGITNEDIRRAKEAGRLIDFLTERFKAFGIAGEASLGTFAVLAANTRDALLQIGEVGLRPFFDEMKGLLQGVLDQVRVLDAATGQVMLNPRAVAIVRAIGEGLTSAVQEARNLSEAITFEQALGSARALSAILATGAEIVRGIATGILRGVNTLRTDFAPLFRVLNFLTGGLFDNA